jgi:hypothetical protein
MSTLERIEANVAAAQTKPVTREACVERMALALINRIHGPSAITSMAQAAKEMAGPIGPVMRDAKVALEASLASGYITLAD